MPSAQAIRRLPLAAAIKAVSSGPGAERLSASVSGLNVRFVAKNSEVGPREFVRTVAPRIAYANPALPIAIDRIPDPRSRSLDPRDPGKAAGAGAAWNDGVPGASMVVHFHDRPARTLPLRHLSAAQIWAQLVGVAGEHAVQGIAAPAGAAGAGAGVGDAEATAA
ncbi:hypothetical protein Q5752_001062 [Cryptotrichosporon argae]